MFGFIYSIIKDAIRLFQSLAPGISITYNGTRYFANPGRLIFMFNVMNTKRDDLNQCAPWSLVISDKKPEPLEAAMANWNLRESPDYNYEGGGGRYITLKGKSIQEAWFEMFIDPAPSVQHGGTEHFLFPFDEDPGDYLLALVISSGNSKYSKVVRFKINERIEPYDDFESVMFKTAISENFKSSLRQRARNIIKKVDYYELVRPY